MVAHGANVARLAVGARADETAADLPAAGGRARLQAVAAVSRHFKLRETTQRSALAAAGGRSPAPVTAARFYPNLGVLLGTVDKKGLSVATMEQGAFDAFVRAEIERNGRIISQLNLKVE